MHPKGGNVIINNVSVELTWRVEMSNDIGKFVGLKMDILLITVNPFMVKCNCAKFSH